ncbi:MAG: hypothetical protein IMX01_07545 [Limnochordaceae bacterium]|nr:hypothetical protein [Limnochordaceae bacterium]
MEARWKNGPVCPCCGGGIARFGSPPVGGEGRPFPRPSGAGGRHSLSQQQKARRTKSEPAPSFPRGGGVVSSCHETGSR